MTRTRTTVVTGSASGIGAAVRARLEADGQRIIGVDIRDAEVVADLGTAEGRAQAIAEVSALSGGGSGGAIDGLATCAGIPGLPGAPGSRVVSINYFGSIALLSGLRPLLAAGERPAAVAISSNSTTCQPGVPMDVVDLCLADDRTTIERADVDAEHRAEPEVFAHALVHHLLVHASTAGILGVRADTQVVVAELTHVDDPSGGR